MVINKTIEQNTNLVKLKEMGKELKSVGFTVMYYGMEGLLEVRNAYQTKPIGEISIYSDNKFRIKILEDDKKLRDFLENKSKFEYVEITYKETEPSREKM